MKFHDWKVEIDDNEVESTERTANGFKTTLVKGRQEITRHCQTCGANDRKILVGGRMIWIEISRPAAAENCEEGELERITRELAEEGRPEDFATDQTVEVFPYRCGNSHCQAITKRAPIGTAAPAAAVCHICGSRALPVT
jgi:hypothetical protein